MTHKSDLPVGTARITENGPSFLTAAAHTFAASALGIPLAFATSVVIARALGPTQKGIFDLALATASLLTLVLGLALPSGITFAVARGLAAARPAAYLAVVVGLGELAGAYLLLVNASALPVLGSMLGMGGTGALTALVAVAVGVGCISAGLKAIAVGRQLIIRANWIDVSARAVLLAAAVLVVALAKRPSTAADFVLVTILASVAGAVGLGWLAIRGSPPGGRVSLQAGLRIAIPSYAANIVQFLNYRLDLFLVAYFLTAADVGFYALAASLGQMIWLISNSIGAVLFPRVASSRDEPATIRRTSQLARLALLSAAGLGLGLGIAAPLLIGVMYGSEYLPALPAIWLLVPGIVAFAPVNVLAAHLAGAGRPELNLATSAASLVATLALDLMLIPVIGIAGAAIATSVSYVSAAIVIVALYSRLTGESAAAAILPRAADLRDILSLARSSLVRRRPGQEGGPIA